MRVSTSIYVCVYVLITIIIKEEEPINLGGSVGIGWQIEMM